MFLSSPTPPTPLLFPRFASGLLLPYLCLIHRCIVFGVGANFLFLASFVLFQLIVEPIMKLFGVQVAGFKNEASRGLVLLDNRKRMVAMRHLAEMPENLRSEFDSVEIYSDEDLARIVFRRLDTNGDGSLQADELKSLVVTLGHSPSKAEKLIAKWDTDGSG